MTRFGKPEVMAPHSISWAWLSAFILWFGWFGFNGGSALWSGSLAVSATIATNIAVAGAALVATILSWLRTGKPSTLMTIDGTAAGLAAITPASRFVAPLPGLFIGFVAGAVFYGVVLIKERLKIDDALDVSSVHGFTGVWGALATGIFASQIINPGGPNGLAFGNSAQLGIQGVGVVVGAIFSFIVCFVILKVLDLLVGIRVEQREEEVGEDIPLHNEKTSSGM